MIEPDRSAPRISERREARSFQTAQRRPAAVLRDRISRLMALQSSACRAPRTGAILGVLGKGSPARSMLRAGSGRGAFQRIRHGMLSAALTVAEATSPALSLVSRREVSASPSANVARFPLFSAQARNRSRWAQTVRQS